MNIVIYTLVAIISILIIFRLWFRLKYPFWSIQPVFHYHMLHYWIFPPGIIDSSIPTQNSKYYNSQIKFNKINSLDTTAWREAIHLISNNFLKEKNCYYNPSSLFIKSVFPYNHSYLSIMTEDKILNEGDRYIQHKKPIGCMTTRPLKCYLGEKTKNKIKLGYVDFLCVHKSHRKQNIAPSVIYSHYVNVRENDDNIHVFCFKREGKINGFVPLTHYSSYVMDISLIVNTSIICPSVKIEKLNTSNLQILYHVLPILKEKYECFMICDISVLQKLIEIGYFKIYVAMMDIVPKAVYIFTDAYTVYDKKKRCIECGSSINIDLDNDDFNNIFLTCMQHIKKEYSVVIMEDLADNNILIERLPKDYLWVSNTAYYFYNFAIKPVLNNKVCIFN